MARISSSKTDQYPEAESVNGQSELSRTQDDLRESNRQLRDSEAEVARLEGAFAESAASRESAEIRLDDAIEARRFADKLNDELCNEILERKGAEEALSESEEKFRTLAAAAPALIWFDDPQGKCLYANKQYFDFHGRPEEDITTLDWEMTLHPKDVDGYIDDFRAAQTEQRPFHHRVRAKRHDDQWRWLESYARPLFAEDGAFLGHVGISTDITESVEAEEELKKARELLEARVEERTEELNRANALLLQEMSDRQKAEEERASLLAKIVTTQEEERRRIALNLHDHLGQRLTGLRLKIASLKEECGGDGQLRSQVERLEEIGALLDSDVNFLAWELRPKALDDLGLVSAVENYVQEWSRHAGIRSEFHSGIVKARRFAAEIETNLYRITQEALNNAHKHGTANTANVILELRDNTIVLIVEDDGKGFDPIERQQAESRRGLGLIGMRERAASVDGTIEIESKPGSGTTVFVKVPAVFVD